MIKKKLSLIVILTLMMTFSFAEMLFYDNPVIKEIKYEGLVNTDSTEIGFLIYLEEGDALNEEDLNDTIKALYALDKFSDAKADIVAEEDGLILTFILEENSMIGDIIIEGNDSIRRVDLEDSITLTEGGYFTERKMKNTITAIQEVYEEDGFVEVDVDYELNPSEEDETVYDLTINISEGDKIVVEDIVITGAEKITPSDIKGVMQTKEKVFILQSGVLDLEELLTDMETIEALYHQSGFLDMQFNTFDWEVEEVDEDDKAHMAIVLYIDVDEGPQYFVGDISITNNTIFTTEELNDFIDLSEGDVYDQISMELAKYNIYNEYSELGHLYANVSVLETKDTNTHVIDAEIVIYEGPRTHIESITISGNDKTKTNVIERELLFEEGELYNQTKVRESYEYLTFLQYFSDIQFIPTPGSAEGLIGLDIEVTEQRTGLLTFGVGYGTESKLNATASVSEQNLFGTGRILSFKGEYGLIRQYVELSFKEPWLFNSPTTASFTVGYYHYLYDDIPTDDDGDGIIDNTNFNYVENPTESLLSYEATNNYYHRQSFNVGFGLSRRLLINGSGFINYSYSMYKDYGASFTNPLLYDTEWSVNTNLIESLGRGWTTKHSIGMGLGIDTSNDPLNPTQGYGLTANLYYIGGIFGGTINYIKPKLSFNYYWNPFWKLVVALHGSTEFIMPQFDGAHDYDTADMLYFDGVYEMRGWQNYTERGESKIFASTEIRIPVYQELLQGVLFFDIGNLWANYDSWSLQSEGYIASFGVGLKIDLPQIPIRFYLARDAFYDSDLSKWQMSESQVLFENWEFVFSIQGLF